jgi:hypothetical protein
MQKNTPLRRGVCLYKTIIDKSNIQMSIHLRLNWLEFHCEN